MSPSRKDRDGCKMRQSIIALDHGEQEEICVLLVDSSQLVQYAGC
jgi:hypothetical protein